MKNIFRLGEQKLSNYVDYLDVITLLQEFTKLKKILFDKQRLEIFKYAKKPSIIYDGEGQEIIQEGTPDGFDSEINYKELFLNYKTLCQCIRKDIPEQNQPNGRKEYDVRLIEEFEHDFKMPFDIIIERE